MPGEHRELLAYRNSTLAAHELRSPGHVANVRPNTGMGIIFTKVEEREQMVLEKWIAELRGNPDQN
jgi:hypothetical protein